MRRRARLVEIAQKLLHREATIRAAGDELSVPTSALRHWLREAGFRIGADGTLTESAGPAPLPGKDQKDRGLRGCADLWAFVGRTGVPAAGTVERRAVGLIPSEENASAETQRYERPAARTGWDARSSGARDGIAPQVGT